MDITRGEFKDFSQSQRSSRIGSRLSSRGSTSGSMELLSPDLSNSQYHQNEKESSEDGDSEYFSAEDEDLNVSNTEKPGQNATREKSSKEQRSVKSSFCSTNSSAHSNESAESEDYELQEAIKKMRKLDRILQKKIKLEKEVKRQRLLYQKSFHEGLALMKVENGSTYSDADNNTSKYLSLLPPPQQLDVLLERNEGGSDFEPIFQTQFQLHGSSVENDLRPKSTNDVQRNEPDTDSETTRKKTTSATSRQSSNKANKDTDFIQRNIELAKDAANLVSMTAEEKQRLSVLLEDIDEVDIDLEDSSHELAALSSGEGYLPDQSEMQRLMQIDERLQTLLTADVYRSISSTPRSKHHIQSLMHANVELATKFSKADLTEARNPSQRLVDVEERLSKLDEKWKEQFSSSGPRLTDDQLYQLLSECSRNTSPNSLTTSLGYREWNDDDTLTSSSSRLSSVTLQSASEANFDNEGKELSQSHDTISREVLGDLLKDARTCLGLDDQSHGIGGDTDSSLRNIGEIEDVENVDISDDDTSN
uniref:Fibrous sheath-interacting protein 1 n=1 Tax=Phallusia mammillata TaxID=59560 RepID=A0A6F9DD37_9ASCI|nr:fibrous sheath-interacting protein 1 [Phallusia mammillata]